MNSNTIDQALAALGDALKSQQPDLNPTALVGKIPHRSLSGDHINGVKVINFSSSGIRDNANYVQLTVENDHVKIKSIRVENVDSNLKVNGNMAVTGTISVDTLEVNNLKADLDIDNNKPIKYSGDIDGKGFLWQGSDYTKQLVFTDSRIFSSEDLDLAKTKNYKIDNVKVLDSVSLGESITKSNLREVGRLKGLIVDGDVVLNNYVYYESGVDRIGIGTDEPNAAVSIAEDGVELILGTVDSSRGAIGTFASHELDILTDNVARIKISTNGDITLGNRKTSPIQTSIHGKLSVKVNTPDPEVDLHVAGPVKFEGKLQASGSGAPTSGEYNKGDIVWNNNPVVGQYVGWVCVKSGNSGLWEPFGKIGHQ